MPQHDKDLKRLVRARMAKTGESYTAARAVLVARNSDTTPPPAAAPPARWPELAGISDEAVQAKTARSWREWVGLLDAAEAFGLSHKEIAKHISATHPEVGPWWAQSVTIGYERIRGLRDIGQQRGGSYDANKSRTYPVDVSTLYGMFADARRRRRWLGEGLKRIRTSRVDTSMRVDWIDGTQVNFTFTAKGPAKSTVALQQVKLPDRDAVEAAKAAWQQRLDALREAL
jgi:hypothetical protein